MIVKQWLRMIMKHWLCESEARVTLVTHGSENTIRHNYEWQLSKHGHLGNETEGRNIQVVLDICCRVNQRKV